MWNWILLGGLAYYLYKQSLRLADSLLFEPTGADLMKQTLDLRISNPTDTEAKILSVDGKVFAGQSVIGTYNTTEPFTIEPKKGAQIKIKFNLDKPEILYSLIEILKTGKTPAIGITGKVGTSIASFDFDKNILPVKSLKA